MLMMMLLSIIARRLSIIARRRSAFGDLAGAPHRIKRSRAADACAHG